MPEDSKPATTKKAFGGGTKHGRTDTVTARNRDKLQAKQEGREANHKEPKAVGGKYKNQTVRQQKREELLAKREETSKLEEKPSVSNKQLSVAVDPEVAKCLTVKQLQVLPLLVQGFKVMEIVEMVGIDRGTISRWLREDELFCEELNRLRVECYQQQVSKAFNVLDKQLDNESEMVKWRAANTITKHHALVTVRSKGSNSALEGLNKLRELMLELAPKGDNIQTIDVEYSVDPGS
jgi:hypothetical protein